MINLKKLKIDNPESSEATELYLREASFRKRPVDSIHRRLKVSRRIFFNNYPVRDYRFRFDFYPDNP